MKRSEGRRPKAEGKPKTEIRRQARGHWPFCLFPRRCRESAFALIGFRPSAFGLPSAFGRFGLRTSALCLTLLLLALASTVFAQPRPYIGFVYPAGGQQGTTLSIRLGGQNLEGVNGVLVTGSGVSAKMTEYYWRLNNQEMQLLNEQARLLRRRTLSAAGRNELKAAETNFMMSSEMMMSSGGTNGSGAAALSDQEVTNLLAHIEKRTAEFVQTPASAAIASLVLVEVTIAPDAEPGEREVRLLTARGVSNPMVFYVGQVPEVARKPMLTASQQVLGKEAQALRKRPAEEEEDRITVPCTVNGQIASGEVNRYRFSARKGQRLVLTTLGRQLVPFLADAVPGWFQPVLAVYDAQGKELAYDDDYRFKPDPTLLFEVPKDGEYVFAIRDSLYRGREDFVYRITIGELPFITSIYPLGAKAGTAVKPQMKGWNLQGAELTPPATDAGPGTQMLVAKRKGLISNRVPFAVSELPEVSEQEPNNTPAHAQRVTLPVIVNGRIDKPDDWDVFQFNGKSNDVVVAEVMARRLDSPLDSVLKLTDAAGTVLAFNDDHEDLAAALNTHHADSYLMARLPADGVYYVHIGDTAQQGGEEYGYRLRISAPRPDFELRVVPSSLALRSKSGNTLTVYAQRKDGFTGPIKLTLKDPPAGFAAQPVTLVSTQAMGRFYLRTTLVATQEVFTLSIVGTAKVAGQDVTHEAVPAEDRMQAFFWRHLVPAKDLKVLVFDPNYQLPPKRVAPPLPPWMAKTNAPAVTNLLVASKLATATNAIAGTNSASGTNTVAVPNKPKFTKQQVAFRLRQLKLLYEEGMLTDEFYLEKVAECEAAE